MTSININLSITKKPLSLHIVLHDIISGYTTSYDCEFTLSCKEISFQTCHIRKGFSDHFLSSIDEVSPLDTSILYDRQTRLDHLAIVCQSVFVGHTVCVGLLQQVISVSCITLVCNGNTLGYRQFCGDIKPFFPNDNFVFYLFKSTVWINAKAGV